jgi:sugar transferase (PEP-CTERM/EpsH1 system associated)
MIAADARPLIAHVVYRFALGGLENGIVNLINRLPAERFRHAVVALTDVTEFSRRVERDDVEFIELHKAPGHGIRLLPRLRRVFARLQPAIVHTRNLAALEATTAAWAARVPIRVHGEHGRDIGDLDGSNRRYRIVRRAHRPFVTQYVALSRDLERYLIDAIGVRPSRVAHIVNGVDIASFTPAAARIPCVGCPFVDPSLRVFGTAGRLQRVKHQTLLARAFVRALEIAPPRRSRLRLIIAGDGPLLGEIVEILRGGNALDLAWLPGFRDDVPDVLRALDAFVLPSLAEGISNTILEAMASGLPVIATDVGGNAELIVDGRTGSLVAADDVDALAKCLVQYDADPALARERGNAGRIRAESLYSIDAMVARYCSLYDRLLAGTRHVTPEGIAAARTHASPGSH